MTNEEKEKLQGEITAMVTKLEEMSDRIRDLPDDRYIQLYLHVGCMIDDEFDGREPLRTRNYSKTETTE